MGLERLLSPRGLTKKQLHIRFAKCGAVASVCAALAAGLDFAQAHDWLAHACGFVLAGLGVMNAGLALFHYRLSRKAGVGAV